MIFSNFQDHIFFHFWWPSIILVYLFYTQSVKKIWIRLSKYSSICINFKTLCSWFWCNPTSCHREGFTNTFYSEIFCSVRVHNIRNINVLHSVRECNQCYIIIMWNIGELQIISIKRERKFKKNIIITNKMKQYGFRLKRCRFVNL